jgi:hypothetical protein
MADQKKNDSPAEKEIPPAPPKLTRRDALKRMAIVAVGIAALPQGHFMGPGEALADETHVPRYRSYARDFDRGYASYSSYTSYTSYVPYSSSYARYTSYHSYYSTVYNSMYIRYASYY